MPLSPEESEEFYKKILKEREASYHELFLRPGIKQNKPKRKKKKWKRQKEGKIFYNNKEK